MRTFPSLLAAFFCLTLSAFLPAQDEPESKEKAKPDAKQKDDADKKEEAKPTPPPQATPADQIVLPPGFKAELLYSVPGDKYGSWVSLTVDDKGRLITSDQYGQLYRLEVPHIGTPGELKIEPIDLPIGMSQGMCFAFGSLYVMVNGGNDKFKAGLYRLKDTNNDDKYDEIKLLREIPGDGEHGPHAVIPGPDGKSLYVCAGNHTKLIDVERSRVPRNWQEDQVTPRMWDAGGHAVGILAPGGWILRTDPDGKEFELVSSGYRNEYDIAFNAEGDLFTYDADMEWDIGTPWYRPTRVCFAPSGSEFGWRSGTGKWPEYSIDSLPPAVNIGPGSPTGITFGTGAKFPAKYQQALYLCDWSYGILYAVHLRREGAGYSGTFERFASAPALPLTDVVVRPQDGALYFAVGGRKTQSGLYRLTYTGTESTAPAAAAAGGPSLHQTRRELDALHQPGGSVRVGQVFQYLHDPDRFIRYSARIALEHQPVDSWAQTALAEREPNASLTALTALARNGKNDLQPKIIESLTRLNFDQLSDAQKLDWIRVAGLTVARMGTPSPENRDKLLKHIAGEFPNVNTFISRDLCQLHSALDDGSILPAAVKLLHSASTQEEQLHLALCLRVVKSGWTPELRKEYFAWFPTATRHRGGHSFAGFVNNIRKEALEHVPDAEKPAIEAILATAAPPKEEVVPPRPFVKKWSVDDLAAGVDAHATGRDFARGRALFAAAACFKCHRVASEGGAIGPDLTGVGGRFTPRVLLESLIDPNKEISDQYRQTTFIMDDGRVIQGKVINLFGEGYGVMTDMLNPGNMTNINRNHIAELQPSKTSMMPQSLLDTLNEDEIYDLFAYLRSGGNPDHPAFKK